jgi:hypothetical protein
MRHGNAVGAFVVGTVAIAGLLLAAAVLPTGRDAGTPARVTQTVVSGMVPLFLISIPTAILFSVLAPALGEWASTVGEAALVVGVLFLNMVVPFGPGMQPLFGWLLLFLASGLATLALMSVSTTLREQERLTGIRLQIDRYWLMIMLAVVCTVLLLGLIVGQIIAPTAILRLLSLLKPVWWLVRQVLLYAIMIFAYLFFSLLEPLLAEMQSRPARPANAFLSPMAPENMEDLARESAEIPPIFTTIMQIVLILGLFGVIALVFYIAARRQERRVLKPDEIVETRESVLSSELLQEQLKGFFDGLRRLRKPPVFAELGPPGDPRRAVREMYQEVLAQAIRLDTPRKKEQTPETYGSTLIDLCSGQEAAIRTLTRVYVIARYGVHPPTPAQVDAAQGAFQAIRTALQAKSNGNFYA